MANKKFIVPIVALMAMAGLASCGTDGVDGKNGKDGHTPVITIKDGNWYVDGVDTGVKAEGTTGQAGDPGHTPVITIKDGYWVIDGVSTGVKAQGTDGAAGQAGTPGAAGKDGVTPHVGDNGNWFIGTTDTNIKAEGTDGKTPVITIKEGRWFIDGVDSGVVAEATDGTDGITPHIGEDNHWFIGDQDTGIIASGIDGITPHIGENGNWFIGDLDTNVPASGVPGQDGAPGQDGEKGEKGDKGDPGESGRFYDADVTKYVVTEEYGMHTLRYKDPLLNGMYGVLDEAEPVIMAEFNTELNDQTMTFIKNGNSYTKGSFAPFTEENGVFSSPSTSSAVKGCVALTITKAGLISFTVTGSNEKNWDFFQARINGQLVDELDTSYKFNDNQAYTIPFSKMVEVGDVIQLGWVSDGGHSAKVTMSGNMDPAIVTFATAGIGSICPKIAVAGKLDEALPVLEKEGQYFDGWYTTPTFDEGTRVEGSPTFTEDTILYAHVLPIRAQHPLMGTHFGGSIYGTSTYSQSNDCLVVDFTGKFTATFGSSTVVTSTFTSYDKATGILTAANGIKAFYDVENGLVFMFSSATYSSSAYLGIFKVGATDKAAGKLTVTSVQYDSVKERLVEIGGHVYFFDRRTADFGFYKNVTLAPAMNADNISLSNIASTSVHHVSTKLIAEDETVLGVVGLISSSSYGFCTPHEFDGAYDVEGDATNKLYINVSGTTVYGIYKTKVATVMYGGKLVDGGVRFISTNTYCYDFALDVTTHKAVFSDVKVTVTLNWNGHTPEGAASTKQFALGSNIYADSYPTVTSVVEGGTTYKFLGWFYDEEFKSAVGYKGAVAEDFMVYAKWAAAYNVTFDPANGTDPTVQVIEEGGHASIANPTYTGYIFKGWFVDGGVEPVDLASFAITGHIKFTAHYEEAPKYVSKYSQHNIYGEYVGARNGSINSYYIDATGKAYLPSNNTTVDFATAYNGEANTLSLKNGKTFTTYIRNGKTLIFYDTIDADWYFLASADGTSAVPVKQFWINTEGAKKWVFNAQYSDGSSYTFFADAGTGTLVPFVTLKDAEGKDLSFASLYANGRGTDNRVIDIYDEGGASVAKFAWNGNTYVGDDGLAGIYTGVFKGSFAAMTLDGYGTVSFDGLAGTYTKVSATRIMVTVGGKEYPVEVGQDTFTQVLDGYQGVYVGGLSPTLSITGYGEGSFGGDPITYTVIQENLLKVNTSSGSSYINVNKNEFTYDYASLSPVAGMTYSGTHLDCWDDPETLTITFETSPEIKGTIMFGSKTFSATVTGSLEGSVITMTFVTDIYNNGLIGKTFKLNIGVDGKLTVSDTKLTSGTYRVQNGTVLTAK